MKLFGTLLTVVAGFAVLASAYPANRDPHSNPLPVSSDPPHGSDESIVEYCGRFKRELDTPDNDAIDIKVPLGVCQRGDENKGVPAVAKFIDIGGAHWCEFYK